MRLTPPLAWVLPGLLLLSPIAAVRAADPPKPEPRVAVAKLTSESGSLVRQEALDKPWTPVKNKGELLSGDLLVGGLDTALQTLNGSVFLKVVGDMADQEPLLILETSLILHASKDVDTDFTLRSGRITVTNEKKSGSATVRIHIRGRSVEVVLKNPGDRFALEIYGRWPAGSVFIKDAKPEEGPPLALILIALKGEVDYKGRKTFNLKAPPGLALLFADSFDDEAPQPQFLDKVPAWAVEGQPSEQVKHRKEALARFRKAIEAQSISDTLDAFVKSDNPWDRRLAVVFMGALDDLPRLAGALSTTKYQDVWDNAVITLRHWIGRGPGQDQALYTRLVEARGYSPIQAEIVLNLLHSFGEEDLAKAETYELLIDYLDSDKLAIRGLANWHLVRLVPQGQKFGYDPLADKAKRDEAVKKWRLLIPAGKLPPKPKLDDK